MNLLSASFSKGCGEYLNTPREIGIGIIGLGVIGGQTARVLQDKSSLLAHRIGAPIVLRRAKVLERDLIRPLVRELPSGICTTSEDDFFSTPGLDIILEAIGGEEPALTYIERALRNGKQVVTPNKEVIAKHGDRLLLLAQENNTNIRFEASVGGGIPLIAPFQRDLVANSIKAIYAIINGTTNYILTQMAEHETEFDQALRKAKELGYAEPDPTNDVAGIDAAYKLGILASLAFHTQVKPGDVYREGISGLAARDFRYGHDLGFNLKLLAIAKDSGGAIEARVHPAFVPLDSFLAKVSGAYNAILVEGDLVGQVTFIGEGAGPQATSSAVVADIVNAARDIISGTQQHTPIIEETRKIRPIEEITTRYYLRLSVVDQYGVLAQIARILGNHMISISSVIQKETNPDSRSTEIVIMTHPAQEKQMQLALDKIRRLGIVHKVASFIRVESEL